MKKTYLLLLTFIFLAANTPAFCATLNLRLYIEGLYLGGGYMTGRLYNCLAPTATGSETDTIFVELHDTAVTTTVAASVHAILMVDGTATCTFSNTVVGHAYYIAVKHRVAVQTWSAVPVIMGATTSYDFSTARSQAYGNNMLQVDFAPDIWAFYTGDLNQDGNIDQIEFPELDFGINNGLLGCYNADLNGDGSVDLLDFPYFDHNFCPGIYAHFP